MANFLGLKDFFLGQRKPKKLEASKVNDNAFSAVWFSLPRLLLYIIGKNFDLKRLKIA